MASTSNTVTYWVTFCLEIKLNVVQSTATVLYSRLSDWISENIPTLDVKALAQICFRTIDNNNGEFSLYSSVRAKLTVCGRCAFDPSSCYCPMYRNLWSAFEAS